MLHYSEFDFSILDNLEIIKNSKKVEYFNIEAGFDIETSSITQGGEKAAFSYIWMFGIGKDNPIYYGRRWDEFLGLVEKISKYLELNSERILTIYVHNLSYEFQFFKDLFNWENVFAISERKPVKALTHLGIEFKDSYILSGYSLANTAKNLAKYKVQKMEGDLDYEKTRLPETPLTEKELGYCENDIQVILNYIKEEIENNGDITKIPLTNTGRVRRYVKNECLYTSKNHKKTSAGKYKRFRAIMRDLTLTPDDYKQCKRGFMGGFTHSNPMMTGEVLEGVDSVDLTSSYPTVMLADKFPMSRPRKLLIDSLDGLKKAFNKFCVLFDVKFTNLKNKIGYESYLSSSKCISKRPLEVNGRIYEAEEVITTITDVDFSIIEAVYSWDKIEISNVKGFVKNYLPKSIITSILKLYGDKTTLKGVAGSEVEYLLSKGMLNSVYGMSVTDIVKDEATFSDSGWQVEEADILESVDEYNDSKNRFLFYPWGIWVTAYARRNLWTAILAVGEDYIYSDTDSVKMLNYEAKHKKYVDKYNETILKKLETMAEHYNLEKNYFILRVKVGKLNR